MPKYKSRATRLSEAVSKIQDGLSEIESLHDEIQEWHDGMEGTNLESTDKFNALEECAQALDQGKDEIENAISELENVEFPGMFG